MKNTRFSKSTAKSTVSTSSKEPKLAGFASQDKAKVIELLMENDNVLLFLYEKLFPVTTLSTNQIMMKTEKSNQAQMARAGSRLSLLTQAGLDRANLSNSTFDLKGEQKGVIPGSRLNLAKHQGEEFEKMYTEASNYARKSFGGNTQIKYKTNDEYPIVGGGNQYGIKNVRIERNIHTAGASRPRTGMTRSQQRIPLGSAKSKSSKFFSAQGRGIRNSQQTLSKFREQRQFIDFNSGARSFDTRKPFSSQQNLVGIVNTIAHQTPQPPPFAIVGGSHLSEHEGSHLLQNRLNQDSAVSIHNINNLNVNIDTSGSKLGSKVDMQVMCQMDENASTPGINQSSVLGPVHHQNQISIGATSLNMGADKEEQHDDE